MYSLVRSLLFLAVVACLYAVVPMHLFAHSSGASFEKITDQYRIDVGYDPILIFENDRVVLDFELWDAQSGDLVAYTRVWTRLEHEGKTVLATGIGKSSIGETTFLFQAYEPGEWVLHVRYERGDDVITDADFPFTVARATEWGRYAVPLGIACAGFLIGMGVVSVILVRRVQRLPRHTNTPDHP